MNVNVNLNIDVEQLAYELSHEMEYTQIRKFVAAICDAVQDWDLDAALLADRYRALERAIEGTEEDMPKIKSFLKTYPKI